MQLKVSAAVELATLFLQRLMLQWIQLLRRVLTLYSSIANSTLRLLLFALCVYRDFVCKFEIQLKSYVSRWALYRLCCFVLYFIYF